MALTIAYFTNRKDPKIEWFAATLRREIHQSGFAPSEIIIVDYYADQEKRRSYIQEKLGNASALTSKLWHITPKPTVWQGAHRKTKRNFFAASNARNTAFARCGSDYIVCVDDLSALAGGWLNQVKHAMEHKYVVLGAYKKVLRLNVSESAVIDCDPFPAGVDSRWNNGSDNGIVRAGGSWLFGCSFGLPIEYAERVNGFDELCDGVSMEDVEFGIRLERAGCQLFYNRNMLTFESEEEHSAPGNEKFVRESHPHPDPSKKGVMSDWYIYNSVVKTHKTWTELNDFTLSDLRKSILSGGEFPIPTREIDWRTGKPLSEA